MGFFDSFARGLGIDSSTKEILDMEYDEDDDILNNNYRETGLTNASSNYGWYTCVKCNKSFRKGDMEIDHIIPKSKGGTNSRFNLQCICRHCNRSKQADMSDTKADLKRRKEELKQQYKDDADFLKTASKLQK